MIQYTVVLTIIYKGKSWLNYRKEIDKRYDTNIITTIDEGKANLVAKEVDDIMSKLINNKPIINKIRMSKSGAANLLRKLSEAESYRVRVEFSQIEIEHRSYSDLKSLITLIENQNELLNR
jgi:hypothetical protein